MRKTYKNKGKGASFAFLNGLIGYQGDECIAWPFCVDNHGYGQGGHEGKSFKAHKKMCELAHGERPSSKHQASHTCDNPPCVNPNHLLWETRRENHLRRRANGTAATNKWGQHGKLTLEQAAEILSLKGTATQQVLADRFGVSKPTIRNIFRGKTFQPGRHDPSPQRQRIIETLKTATEPVRRKKLIEVSGTDEFTASNMIYRMIEDGKIERVSSGLFRLATS